MTPIVPPVRPKLAQGAAAKVLTSYQVTDKVAVIGVRGYYAKTMGGPGNDRGIFDDAMFVLSPTVFAAFNANTDPSIVRKGIAVLTPGVWRYQKGKHKRLSPLGYPAFVQAGPVTVLRDDVGLDTGWFGINIHRGGENTTSSEGCQTLYKPQWEAFRALVYGELDRYQQTTFPYVLVLEMDIA